MGSPGSLTKFQGCYENNPTIPRKPVNILFKKPVSDPKLQPRISRSINFNTDSYLFEIQTLEENIKAPSPRVQLFFT
jgi:hypothetical protein